MSDQPWEMNDYLNYIGEQTERVAAALEKLVEMADGAVLPPARRSVGPQRQDAAVPGRRFRGSCLRQRGARRRDGDHLPQSPVR